MRKTDPNRIEMIRPREPAGYCFLNRSHLAEQIASVPTPSELPSLVESKWWDAQSTMGGFVNSHDAKPAAVATKLRVVFDETHLFAGFFLEEPEMDRTHAFITKAGERRAQLTHPELEEIEGNPLPYVIEKDDSVELLLDALHKNRRYVKLFVNLAGVSYAGDVEYSYTDAQVYPSYVHNEGWSGSFESEVHRGADFWCAAFKLAWSDLGLDAPAGNVIGLNARRNRTVTEWNHHLLAFAPSELSALDFDDLWLGTKPIEVEEIDFGFPTLAENTFSLKLRNASAEALELACRAELTIDSLKKVNSSDIVTDCWEAGESKAVELKYGLDWHEPRQQTLEIVVSRQGDEEAFFRTQYSIGYCNGDVLAEQPYGFSEPQPDPDPSDPEFVEKKRKHILSRLPKFHRITSNEGGPSDFTLRSACGTYIFNLMSTGVLREIAGMVADLFPDPNNRLVALSLLSHQRAFSIHMKPHVALHSEISCLSALRLNSGHCFSRALVWLGIARELKTGDGEERYGSRAHAVLVQGHVMATIDVGDGERILFDPTFGSFYYRWDNKAFATVREMERDLTIADRALRHRRKNFVFTDYHRPIPDGMVVFPQGAVVV